MSEEVAFIAYHFHWSAESVVEMPHWEREMWCGRISEINRRVHEETVDRRGR